MILIDLIVDVVPGCFLFQWYLEDCCRDFAWMVYLECLQWSATFLLVEARMRKDQDLT